MDFRAPKHNSTRFAIETATGAYGSESRGKTKETNGRDRCLVNRPTGSGSDIDTRTGIGYKTGSASSGIQSAYQSCVFLWVKRIAPSFPITYISLSIIVQDCAASISANSRSMWWFTI
jgi:hypothetical protein|uniref:Uncharacterized protein n=1 Tax=Picea glauca TaxID=3330 RepID=A0A117NGF9_PICGL|nr:hypothetical protein ABT39_MTgene1423 [Picea glauca]